MTKVLVVEDEPLNMELILEILNAMGFTAHGAKVGEEAIKKIEKELLNTASRRECRYLQI